MRQRTTWEAVIGCASRNASRQTRRWKRWRSCMPTCRQTAWSFASRRQGRAWSCGSSRRSERGSHPQQLLCIAAQDLHLVLRGQWRAIYPRDAGPAFGHERPIHGEEDAIDAELHHAAQEGRGREEATRGDPEVPREDVAEGHALALARPVERLVEAPELERQRLAEMPEDHLELR